MPRGNLVPLPSPVKFLAFFGLLCQQGSDVIPLRCSLISLMFFGMLAGGAPAETVVEPCAAVSDLYITLPEEMARLNDLPRAMSPETHFRWKAGLPAILEIVVGSQTNSVTLTEGFERWPALIADAVSQAIPGTPPSVTTGTVPPITTGKVDFWSLLKRLEVAPSNETKKSLGATEAMNLADVLLMLAVETAMNYDPNAYRLAARAIAFSQYAARTDPALAGPAAIRLAVALRIQGESALALQLVQTPPEDPASRAWAAHVRMLSSQLETFRTTPPSDFIEKLWAFSLAENKRHDGDDALWDYWKERKEDTSVFALMVRCGGIVLGRRTEGGVFPLFLKTEPAAIKAWAKRLDPSSFSEPQVNAIKRILNSCAIYFKRAFEARVRLFVKIFELFLKRKTHIHPREPARSGATMPTIAKQTEETLDRLPNRPLKASWLPSTEEVKALVRGRREIVFWSRVRMYTSMWGVPSALPMAKAWKSVSPDSSLAHLALTVTTQKYGSGEAAPPAFPVPTMSRTLFLRAFASMTHPGWLPSGYATDQWCEEQPAEAEIALWNAYAKTDSNRDSLPFAEKLAAALRRHPQSDSKFYSNVIARSAHSWVRETGLALIGGMTNAMPEKAEAYSTPARIHFDLKRDVETASKFLLDLRRVAPDDGDGYLEGAKMLHLREQTKEALEILETANGRVKEDLACAAIDGLKARYLLQLGQTNEAVRIVREAATCGSGTAMENHRDVAFSAGLVEEAIQAAEDEWERYEYPPLHEELMPLPELKKLREQVYAQMAMGWRYSGWCLRFFEIADRHDLLSEAPINAIPVGWYTTWLRAALLRRDGRWEDAVAVLDTQQQAYVNAKWGTQINRWRFLIQMEKERALAKSKSLNCTREEGFLVEGHWIGPFPNWSGEGYAKVYPPETEFDLNKAYTGTSGIVCRWKPWKAGGLNPFFRVAEDPFDFFPAWNTYYLRCVIQSEQVASKKLQVVDDGGFYGVCLNGAWLGDKGEGANIREYDIQLQPGENVFLIKHSLGSGLGSIALRIK